ncbi:hypothetical protein J2X57_002013 [Luteibacter sp. 1214]|uniref:J domain-containing protein n=1 Tax=Luteibacter sp. 1214 TaxID=2817735 RepID=UPI0028616888|nr:J domain-containing protein [Luteibacter sp. 1214]MDR6642801.1 hypothetical protein [Luteibacter sp. 1214]
MTIPAHPLAWPTGWKRTSGGSRATSSFGTKRTGAKRRLTIAEAVARVRHVLALMGAGDDDLVISTNLRLRVDGFPRSDQAEPADPGVAVYWRPRRNSDETMRCMAIDLYDRVADNLAAVAATLDAMRAIERHGGAAILDRAFTGFVALPRPTSPSWPAVLGVAAGAPDHEVRAAYRRLRAEHHPDRGGDRDSFEGVQAAWLAYCHDTGQGEGT